MTFAEKLKSIRKNDRSHSKRNSFCFCPNPTPYVGKIECTVNAETVEINQISATSKICIPEGVPDAKNTLLCYLFCNYLDILDRSSDTGRSHKQKDVL